MEGNYRHHFAELCARIDYNTVVFIAETGDVLGMHDVRYPQASLPEKCTLTVNFDQIPSDRSLVFYGQNLVLDNQTIICSGSVNLINIGTQNIAIVFYESRIPNFRGNQLPRILWKNRDGLYLGNSEYVPVENSLSHTMVGFTDEQLFSAKQRKEHQLSDEAVFKNETCFWDQMGKITINFVSTLVRLEKFPYYSEEGNLLGLILAYQPIQQAATVSGIQQTEAYTPIYQGLINRLLSAANIFIAIQSLEGDKKIESHSENLEKLGYDVQRFASGELTMKDIIYPGDYDRYQSEVQSRLYTQKETFWLTVRLVNVDHEIIPAKIFFSPMVGIGGKITRIAMLIDLYDVTEEVSMNFEKLKQATDRMHVVFTVRKMSDFSEYEIMTENIHQFGYTADEFLNKKLSFRDLIVAEDLPAYQRALETVKSHESMQKVVEYRLKSKKNLIYWLKETMFSTTVRGVEYLESAILNITSTKAAFETLKKMNESLDSVPEAFQRISSQYNFASVLKYADVQGLLEKFAGTFGIGCALFSSYDALTVDTSPKSGALDFVMKQLEDFTAFSLVDQVHCLYDNLWVRIFPVINGEHRIGTLLCYATVKDQIPVPGMRMYEDFAKILPVIRIADEKPLIQMGRLVADNIAKVVFSASVAVMQIQASSGVVGDLDRQRVSHEILLDVLNIANQNPDIARCFELMMPKVAEAMNLTRVSMLLYDPAADEFNMTLEWYVPEEVSRKSTFQHLKKNRDSFYGKWDFTTQISHAISTERSAAEKRPFHQMVRAVVGVRLMNQNELYGALNFVDNFTNRTWTDDEIRFFEDLGYIFSSVIERALSKDLILQSLQEYTRSLELMPSPIAVLERGTENCLFANQKFLAIVPVRAKKSILGPSPKEITQFLHSVLETEADPLVESEIRLPESDQWYMIQKSDILFEGGVESSLLILTDITQKKKVQETISSMAFTDVLTGLPNRMKLEMDLHDVIRQAGAEPMNQFICLFNIDNFRMINNTFSYSAGDELLKVIAKKLSVIPEIANRLYRFAGDEFVILVNPTQGLQIYEFAARVMSVFEKPFFIGGYETTCTISMGMVFLSDAEGGADDLLRKANISLKDAKLTGKNRFVLYDASIRKYEEDIGSMERALKLAVDEGCQEFSVFFQPIVSAKTGKVVSAEALIRWFSRDFGMVSPVKFIPIAESTGLIVPLGKFILNAACKEAKKWLDYGYDIRISVNFSVIQTLQSDLVETIKNAIETYRIPPKHFVFEVTESLAINDINKVIEILTLVRDTGALIAMDDFGTGYSSLNHLRKMPLDIVKIDRSFIFNIEYDPYTVAFVDTIAKFCHMKNTEVCCEGVESETQKKTLQSINVDTMQGYLFGKPCSADDFWKLLINRK